MREQGLAGLWTIGALAVWAFLATRNPDLTYHFAPLIAAAAWPVAGSRAHTAVVSGILTLATSIGLAAAGSLEGPDLVGGHAALAEAVLFTFAGAAGGAAWTLSRSRRTTSSG